MRLTPWEEERLLIFSAAELARRHRAAGIALNAPEAIALMCDAMLEAARAGSGYADVEAAGLAAVSPDEVLSGVRELIEDVRVEVLLGDGARLVVLLDPLGRGAPPDPTGPGAVVPGSDARGTASTAAPVDLTAGFERRTLEVRSTSRRAIRVSSHFPFDRVNRRLEFDRSAAAGFRLDLEAGSSERWAPGENPNRDPRALRRQWGQGSVTRLSPAEHRARFGPSAGDRIRLGDTDLWIRVEEDRQALGDEPIWGYAKDIRLGMTQSGSAGPSELDAVVVGAIVVDPLIGIIKADIGIKDGRIAGVGRAGNPAISHGIDLRIGPHTRPINGYGLIATPGAVDSHIHFISPNLIPAALSGGVTTLISAGFTEPPARMERTLRGMEGYAVNVGLQSNARSMDPAALELLLDAGAIGFKIHEDYGAYPELIDATLRFADAHDVSVSLHTDGLHESAELEDTIAAIAGRTVHAYHVEGTGGGHVPDLIGIVREASVICSSTTPTIPWGVSAVDEGVPMTILSHGATFGVAEDMQLIRERTHPATMAAEGPLHELGAIAIVNSDSQGMGRIMETVRRTFQLAHAMKAWRRSAAGRGHPGLPADPGAERDDTAEGDGAAAGDGAADDNERVLRYLAKVTIEPAITHGVADHVGTLAPGRLADIVLWKPAYFGVKPELVIKGGHPAWAPLGEGNATVEGAEPTRYAAEWAGLSHGAPSVSALFVASSADQPVLRRHLDTHRELIAVSGCRGLTRASLARNRATAPIDVDPVDGRVTLAGRPLATEPLSEVPLSRRYLLR